jgi:hypothetical protein
VIAAMRSGDGEHLTISPAVAGARMAGSLGWAAAGRLGVAMAVTGQAYDVGPASLLLHLDDAGLVERIAVRGRALAVLPDNPHAARATAGRATAGRATAGRATDVHVLPDLAALSGWAAARIVATLVPLIDELHRVTRFGRVPMWNLVADAVLGPATTVPRSAGLDQGAGREVGFALIDAMVAAGAPIRRVGTLRQPSADSSGILEPVRGSCCLYFRQAQPKCATCPLINS